MPTTTALIPAPTRELALGTPSVETVRDAVKVAAVKFYAHYPYLLKLSAQQLRQRGSF